MLIDKINSATDVATAIAHVEGARANLRTLIENTNDADKLRKLAIRIHGVSRKSTLATPLEREAEIANKKAADLERDLEWVAKSIVFEGAAFFKKHGKRVSPRIFAMYNRYGSWAAVHARLVNNGFGGKNFEWLRSEKKLELTSEWFVAHFAPHMVSDELRVELDALIAGTTTSFQQAA